MAQWVTNSGQYSSKLSTGIFLMEWCSAWNIQQSTLVLIDYLFEMPHHRCAWGTCNSDSRYKDRDYMNGVIFFMFPKPFPEDDLHPATIKCLGWIKSCGRPADQLNIKRIHEDFVKKKKYYRVCSKVNSLHFPSFNPLGQPVLVYGQFECKFNSLGPSDSIWRHELRQHWLM